MSEHEPSWIGVGQQLRSKNPRDALGLEARAALVERIGEAWLEPARLEALPDAVVQTSGYTRAMLRWGLDEACSRWTVPELLHFVDSELQGLAGGRSRLHDLPMVVGQVLASTVPPAGFEAIVLMLLGGSSVLVRPARALAGLTGAFVESIREVAPGFMDSIACVSFDWANDETRDAFVAELDALVVHGSSATVASWGLAAERHGVPLVSYGHKISAACVGPEIPKIDKAETDNQASYDQASYDQASYDQGEKHGLMTQQDLVEGLALDIAAWDQTGCLSPQALYIHGGRDRVRELADSLLTQLQESTRALLPAPLDTGTRTLRRNWARSRAFEAELLEGDDGSLLLLYDEARRMEAGPGHRVLQVYPVDSWDQIVSSLAECAPHLQCISLTGWYDVPMAALEAAGLNRVCPPGQMQKPPLDWLHDGIGTLRPLVDALRNS